MLGERMKDDRYLFHVAGLILITIILGLAGLKHADQIRTNAIAIEQLQHEVEQLQHEVEILRREQCQRYER